MDLSLIIAILTAAFTAYIFIDNYILQKVNVNFVIKEPKSGDTDRYVIFNNSNEYFTIIEINCKVISLDSEKEIDSRMGIPEPIIIEPRKAVCIKPMRFSLASMLEKPEVIKKLAEEGSDGQILIDFRFVDSCGNIKNKSFNVATVRKGVRIDNVTPESFEIDFERCQKLYRSRRLRIK